MLKVEAAGRRDSYQRASFGFRSAHPTSLCIHSGAALISPGSSHSEAKVGYRLAARAHHTSQVQIPPREPAASTAKRLLNKGVAVAWRGQQVSQTLLEQEESQSSHQSKGRSGNGNGLLRSLLAAKTPENDTTSA